MWDRLSKARRTAEQAEMAHQATSPRATPSLARDALIIMVEPNSGPLRHASRADFVVAGALLVELVREGRISASGEGKHARVSVLDPSPLGVVELDDALASIRSGIGGATATRIIRLLPRANGLMGRLLDEGVIVREERRKLGLITAHRYNPALSAGREQLVARSRQTLMGESVPDERTALLVSVLSASGNLKRCVPKGRFKEAQHRAAEIRDAIGDSERSVLSAVDVAAINAGTDYSSGV